MADKAITATVKDPTANEVKQIIVTMESGVPVRITLIYDLVDGTGKSWQGAVPVNYVPAAATKTAIVSLINSTGLEKIRVQEGM